MPREYEKERERGRNVKKKKKSKHQKKNRECARIDGRLFALPGGIITVETSRNSSLFFTIKKKSDNLVVIFVFFYFIFFPFPFKNIPLLWRESWFEFWWRTPFFPLPYLFVLICRSVCWLVIVIGSEHLKWSIYPSIRFCRNRQHTRLIDNFKANKEVEWYVYRFYSEVEGAVKDM